MSRVASVDVAVDGFGAGLCHSLYDVAVRYDPLLLPFLLVYLYAGRQTWRLVMLCDHDNDACELRAGMEARDPAAYAIFGVFLLAWPAIMFYSWAQERLTKVPP